MTGIPARIMGNGEGFTTLILTNAESLEMRAQLEELQQGSWHRRAKVCEDIFNRGVQRATERIAAEFKLEQEQRKALKSDQDATVQKGKT